MFSKICFRSGLKFSNINLEQKHSKTDAGIGLMTV